MTSVKSDNRCAHRQFKIYVYEMTFFRFTPPVRAPAIRQHYFYTLIQCINFYVEILSLYFLSCILIVFLEVTCQENHFLLLAGGSFDSGCPVLFPFDRLNDENMKSSELDCDGPALESSEEANGVPRFARSSTG